MKNECQIRRKKNKTLRVKDFSDTDVFIAYNYFLKYVILLDCYSFCNDISEPILHEFASCKKIQPLWNALIYSILIHVYEICCKNVSFMFVMYYLVFISSTGRTEFLIL